MSHFPATLLLHASNFDLWYWVIRPVEGRSGWNNAQLVGGVLLVRLKSSMYSIKAVISTVSADFAGYINDLPSIIFGQATSSPVSLRSYLSLVPFSNRYSV